MGSASRSGPARSWASSGRTVAAVVVVLIVIFVVDPVVAALAHGYGKFSLQGLGMSMSGSGDENADYPLFAPGIAALVYLGYVAVLMAAAALVVPERDVG